MIDHLQKYVSYLRNVRIDDRIKYFGEGEVELDWKLIPAIWGAFLSTYLFLDKMLSEKPILVLEPMSNNQDIDLQFYNLRIVNPTDFPINFHFIKISKPENISLNIFNSQQASRPFVPENLLVYPDSEIILRFDLSGHDGDLKIKSKWEFLTGRFGFTRSTALHKSAKSLERIRNLNERAVSPRRPNFS